MNFDYMDEAVEAICKSLENEPEKWVFETYTFHKRGSSVRYWSTFSSITEIWDGRASHTVFSGEQGDKIKSSYHIARAKQADLNQIKVLKDIVVSEKPWYKFWQSALNKCNHLDIQLVQTST